jgi:hypothetical protein
MSLSLTRSESMYLTIIMKNPPNSTSFMSTITGTSGRLHSEFVRLLCLQYHRETDFFFADSGVHLRHSISGLFHFHHTTFCTQFQTRVGNILAKSESLRVNLNLDGEPINSRRHTHPSHSQTSRLLTSSLS